MTGRQGRALALIGRERTRSREGVSALLDRLAYTPSRNDKLRLLADYFASTPDPDRGWALAALTDGLFFRLPLRRILGEMIEARVDPVLFGLSRDYVGDTAETIALIWPGRDASEPAPRLDDVVQTLKRAMPTEVPGLLSSWLDGLDATERWTLLKLLTGALRVGVSARLAKTAPRRMVQGAACRDRGGLARTSSALHRAVRLAVRLGSTPSRRDDVRAWTRAGQPGEQLGVGRTKSVPDLLDLGKRHLGPFGERGLGEPRETPTRSAPVKSLSRAQRSVASRPSSQELSSPGTSVGMARFSVCTTSSSLGAGSDASRPGQMSAMVSAVSPT